jgi:hypothetical protein
MNLLEIITELSKLAGDEGKWVIALAYRGGKLTTGSKIKDSEIYNTLFKEVIMIDDSFSHNHSRYYEGYADMCEGSGDSVVDNESKLKYYKLATNYFFFAMDRGCSYALLRLQSLVEKIKNCQLQEIEKIELSRIQSELVEIEQNSVPKKAKLCKLSREIFSSLIRLKPIQEDQF